MTKKTTKAPASPIAKNLSLEIKLTWQEVEPIKTKVEAKLAKQVKIDGFRPGKVPVKIAREYLAPDKVIEQVLGQILPQKFVAAIKDQKVQPIAEPEYQVKAAEIGKEWLVVAEYASAPQVEVKGYEAVVKKAISSKEKDQTDDQVLGEIYRALVEKYGPQIPELLVKRETQSELEELVHQLEHRKVSLEQYLASTKQKFEDLTAAMAGQAIGRLQLNFVLGEITQLANIEVSDQEIKEQLKDRANDPYLRRFVTQTLLRQKLADHLLELAGKKRAANQK